MTLTWLDILLVALASFIGMGSAVGVAVALGGSAFPWRGDEEYLAAVDDEPVALTPPVVAALAASAPVVANPWPTDRIGTGNHIIARVHAGNPDPSDVSEVYEGPSVIEARDAWEQLKDLSGDDGATWYLPDGSVRDHIAPTVAP